MAMTIIGLFDEHDSAESAINTLQELGYNPKDISVVMKDLKAAHEVADTTGANVAGGAAAGATTGAVIGGLAGLLIGVGAISIPGIGGLLIGGPLAAALGLTGAAATTTGGAVTGAIAGGLLGGLMGLGIPKEEAQVYETEISKGAILLAVAAADNQVEEVKDVFDEYDATRVTTVSDSTGSVRTVGIAEDDVSRERINRRLDDRSNYRYSGGMGTGEYREGGAAAAARPFRRQRRKRVIE